MFDVSKLTPGWHVLDAAASEGLTAELYREIGEGHFLQGSNVVAVARRDDNDDVLYRHQMTPLQYTIVHLTWIKGRETSPAFPGVLFHGTAEALVAWDQDQYPAGR